MVEICAFRSMTYNPAKVGGLALVTAHPYDMKDAAQVKGLQSQHPHNIARVLWGEVCETDKWDYNRFRRAGQLLKNWFREGVFIESEEPAIFVYNTLFSVRERTKERKGFLALGKLEELGKGKVYPHERTIPKIKDELLSLTRATLTDFGPTFMLYTDPEFRVNKALEPETMRVPDIEVADRFGVIHRLWRVANEKVVEKVARRMRDTELFIADGHHRYETALRFRDEARSSGLVCEGCEGYEYILMKFVNIDDPALTIRPFHRVVKGLEDFNADDFLSRIAERFEIAEYPFKNEQERERAKIELLEDHHVEGLTNTVFGVALKGKTSFLKLKLRDSSFLNEFIAEERCEVWKRLDVTVLHKVVLENILGIRGEYERDKVDFVGDAESALDLVEGRDCQLVFILNPAKMQQLKAVASRLEAMPEKTTDFYPKPLIGLVMTRWRVKGGVGTYGADVRSG